MQESTKGTTSNAIADVIWFIAALGAINWGLIGFFNYNLVDAIFTEGPTRVIYAIIGLCGVASLVLLPLMRVRPGLHGTPAEARGGYR
ncbi:MAG TPA: DUF378 domain-containing protein [Kofleriaceae bacterium]|nr:DUF378 domain-containing protein [Kofleriaceae bacterium]